MASWEAAGEGGWAPLCHWHGRRPPCPSHSTMSRESGATDGRPSLDLSGKGSRWPPRRRAPPRRFCERKAVSGPPRQGGAQRPLRHGNSGRGTIGRPSIGGTDTLAYFAEQQSSLSVVRRLGGSFEEGGAGLSSWWREADSQDRRAKRRKRAPRRRTAPWPVGTTSLVGMVRNGFLETETSRLVVDHHPAECGLCASPSTLKPLLFATFIAGEAKRVVGDDWLLGQQVGIGSFSVVWYAKHRRTGREGAVKEIPLGRLDDKLKQVCILAWMHTYAPRQPSAAPFPPSNPQAGRPRNVPARARYLWRPFLPHMPSSRFIWHETRLELH